MFKSSDLTLEQFKEVLLQLPENCYDQACPTLSGASIGQHTRHIIELYQCLLSGYDTSEVCYDNRKRDKRIEQDIAFAVNALQQIQQCLEQPDKNLVVTYELDGREVTFQSNYFREVMYNLEHTIHHEALIKVAILQLTNIAVPASFGVAPSTLQFRKACVQ
ncbi:DinB family protein [Arenibacter sp. GZD96]|uniref:hypothetical protein n=1 Tax=Aurantibrevibacter litoralis TaxID=3106030 RepID=UPI002AFF6991|nr:hypothetical protein [Arenibacter sp. GZD-96]MEA1786744.1 DinB family protein [Arenibacter sp. GZD-96]